MSEVHVRAPAKVNLHLEVLGIRDDGYHEIRSLFQMVSLSDSLVLRSLEEEGAFILVGSFSFPVEENLIYRAVELFRRETGITTGLRIGVDKKIPIGAGLGGGSSDAAAALIGLQALFRVSLGRQKLHGLASRLGSDVLFFLNGPVAIVTGRGEKVKPIPPRGDYSILIAIPPFSIATKEAFQWLDEDAGMSVRRDMPVAEIEERYTGSSVYRWDFSNAFDEVLSRRYEYYARARDELLGAGAAKVGCTGTGSAVIAVFAGRHTAGRKAQQLQGRLHSVSFAEPLERSPTVEYIEGGPGCPGGG